LIFAEPDSIEAGARRFNIAVQGKPAFKDLDVVKEAGGRLRTIVKEVANVDVEDVLTIRLTPSVGTTILSGIEVIAQDKKRP
jgi:hypothetical protein